MRDISVGGGGGSGVVERLEELDKGEIFKEGRWFRVGEKS